MLADLGARVIKIERPGEGDETRRGYIQLDPARDDQSTYFIRINAGKLSVGLDLGHADARAVLLDLARGADVAIENFVPGVAARLGCDHATLASVRPDIVYCSISGFGQTGPLRDLQAFAHIIHAISGLMHLEQQGEPTPRIAFLQAADVLAGTHAFGVILAALLRRARTGQGAYLDVSMLEALIAAEDVSYGAVLNGGAEIAGPRAGFVVQRIGDRDIVTQTVGAPQLWPRLVAAMGRPELATDPRFATRLARRERWPELQALIGEWLAGFPTADKALETLAAARLPAAPVLSPREVVAHPHLAARGFFPGVPHPARGTARVTGMPVHIDGRPVGPTAPAPHEVGAHTRAVLSELGYSAARLEELAARGAIAI
jgi:CoA:oxalate CoA-transferase